MIQSSYCLKNPFLAKVEHFYKLNKEGSSKSNHHVRLCIDGSNIEYEVGSSFGLLPDNPKNQVQKILKILELCGLTEVTPEKIGKNLTIEEFLTKHINIFRVTKKLAKALLPFQDDSSLSDLLENGWKEYCSKITLSKFLDSFYKRDLASSDLCNLLSPMLPRFYSVASSQRVMNNKIELLVADFSYDFGDESFQSITTEHLLTKNPIRLFLQQNTSFTLPCPKTPIIMIGPGTGIAAFKGFIQERVDFQKAKDNFLFTGDRHREFDYYYEDEFSTHQDNGYLQVQTAFSRDDKEKVYVQHKLWEQREMIFDLLFHKKAHLFISGDAKKMAKDVVSMICKIIAEKRNLDKAESLQVYKSLKKNKQIHLDVY